MNKSIHRITLLSILVACALVFSWLEAQIPAFFMVPGMKLGLTNIVVVVSLYMLGEKEALIINIVRILIVSMTFGNAFSLMYSIAGALLSFVVMIMCYRFTSFNTMAISIAGGIAHNIGQILVAMFVFDTTKILYYLPFLWFSGIVAGAIIGIVSGLTIQRLPKIYKG